MVYEITEENFQKEVVNSPIPYIIEFTAGWCTLCDAMVPTFENLSEEFAGKVKFGVINIDEQKKLRIMFAVAAIPYIVFITNGTKTPLFDELVTEERLAERIRFMLDGGKAPTTSPLGKMR